MTRRSLPALAVALAPLALGACSPYGTVVSVGAMAGEAAVQERGFTAAVEDSVMRARINEAYLRTSETILLNVGIRVHEGRVLLYGGLKDEALRDKAIELAWKTPGVREVIDELQPTEGDTGSYTRDALIRAQINTRITFDGDVMAVNYFIDVFSNTVYLMGVAQNEDELRRVVAHASEVNYVRRVVSYVLLKDDPRRAAAAKPPG